MTSTGSMNGLWRTTTTKHGASWHRERYKSNYQYWGSCNFFFNTSRLHLFQSKSSMKCSMMLSKAAVSLFVWSSVVSAWAPRHLLSQARHVRYSGRILATQLHSSTLSAISTEVLGTEQTESFRLSFKESSKSISPWHDIPVKNADGTYNMVSQITNSAF